MQQIKKLDKLEAIRGFAAIYVIIGHTFKRNFILEGIDLSSFFRFGQEAVILFFLLSGFVIEYSFSRGKDQTFKTYFYKRFLRIYVPLFCIYLLNFFLFFFNNNNEIKIDWFNFIGNVFMLQDMSSLKPNVITSPFLGNLPLWSLSYEWWFYMLYFPIVTFMKNKSSNFVYALGIVSAFTYIFYPNFINRELFYFVIWWSGVVLARCYAKNNEIKFSDLKRLVLVLFVIIIFLVVNAVLNYNGKSIGISPILEIRHFVFSFIIIVFAVMWNKSNWIGFNLVFGVFKKFAPISYCLYISHYFLISNANYLDNIVSNSTVKLVIYIINCIIISYLIERVIYPQANKYLMRKISGGDKVSKKIVISCQK
jgi:peptidoglycan/LPS O-acetylase OafA/YrhL